MKRPKLFFSFSVVWAALLSPSTASAVPSIANPGFELDAQGDGGWADLTPASWSKYQFNNVGGTGVADPDINDAPPAVGAQFGYAYAFNGSSAATLYQQADTVFAPNTTYTLSVLVGDAIRDSGSGGYDFPDIARIGIYNSSVASGGVLTSPEVVNNITTTPGDGVAAYYTAMFTTGAVAPLGSIFIGLSAINGATGSGVDLVTFDDVTLTAVPVPEPASLVLFAFGTVGALLVARRRKAFTRN